MTWTTHFVDAGARYGLHPSMREFLAPRRIWAFEPDPEEFAYLSAKYANAPDYAVFQDGLGVECATRKFRILKHRGLSTALEPNLASVWFRDLRAGEGEVTRTITMEIVDLPSIEKRHGIKTDFLKIDVEGMEIEILQGAGHSLDHISAIKAELLFDKTYGKATAPEIVDFLVNKNDFLLVNLDYAGRGMPINYFCPSDRWGALVGCEAFFIRDLRGAEPDDIDAYAEAHLKAIVFCFMNNAPDLALSYACQLFDHNEVADALHENDDAKPLMAFFELLFLRGAYQLKNQPGEGFSRAAADYRRMFKAGFPEPHEYFRHLDKIKSEHL